MKLHSHRTTTPGKFESKNLDARLIYAAPCHVWSGSSNVTAQGLNPQQTCQATFLNSVVWHLTSLSVWCLVASDGLARKWYKRVKLNGKGLAYLFPFCQVLARFIKPKKKNQIKTIRAVRHFSPTAMAYCIFNLALLDMHTPSLQCSDVHCVGPIRSNYKKNHSVESIAINPAFEPIGCFSDTESKMFAHQLIV